MSAVCCPRFALRIIMKPSKLAYHFLWTACGIYDMPNNLQWQAGIPWQVNQKGRKYFLQTLRLQTTALSQGMGKICESCKDGGAVVVAVHPLGVCLFDD